MLGEIVVEQKIGKVEFIDNKKKEDLSSLGEPVLVNDLYKYLCIVADQMGWKDISCQEDPWYIFERKEAVKEEEQLSPRTDIFLGATIHPNLIQEYRYGDGKKHAGKVFQRGAEYMFAMIRHGDNYDGDVNTKWKMEREATYNTQESINRAFNEEKNGIIIGHGFGFYFTYIDFMAIDGIETVKEVNDVLRETGREVMFGFFTPGKRDILLGLDDDGFVKDVTSWSTIKEKCFPVNE
jgi:hypothetical protein